MPDINLESLNSYRAETFRLNSNKRVTTKEEAIEFVNKRGFVYFWPIKDILLPSLWVSVAGDRAVADAHDDPGHVTWGWKDSLLGEKKWYYAKVLRKKATMIALDIAPFYYALSENYGSPEEDYLTIYEQGRLTQEAKVVYEAILDEGPLDTIALRRAARLTSKESNSRFDRALSELQKDFKILPIGVAEVGGWRYAFIYDTVPRHYPNLPERAHYITEHEAYQKLITLYFISVGAAQIRDVTKLFQWKKNIVEKELNNLVDKDILKRDLTLENHTGEWIALPGI
jgi:hypothetical protein